MTQTRMIPQVKTPLKVYEKLIRDFAIKELLASELITPQEALALATAPVLIRATEDGNRAILLDPVWPEA